MTIAKEYYAKGKRGLTYTAEVAGRKVIIKEPNPAASVNTIRHEAQMLQLANAVGVGPTFLMLEEDAIVMEFIAGEEILDWAQHASAAELRRVTVELLQQCRRLDAAGINKTEMNHPTKHVLIRDGQPVQIDFDRARRMSRPKNVTQLCQWLVNSAYAQLLRHKGVLLDKRALLAAAQEYKASYDDAAFRRITEQVGRF